MSKILITGVAGGIGNQLAISFKHSGYFVIGIDIIEPKNEIVDVFINCDLNDYVESADLRQQINRELMPHLQGLNVLINNAAVQIQGAVNQIELNAWKKTQNVNVTAPMLLSQLCANQLEKNQGSIINIASIHQQQTKPRFVSYATSKSALVGLTKAMAVDFNGKVRVNAISPAAIDTEMLRAGFDNNDDQVELLKMIHPSGRIGKPEEVAETALFLASSKAIFLNGTNVQLDGGISSVLKDLE